LALVESFLLTLLVTGVGPLAWDCGRDFSYVEIKVNLYPKKDGES
jgi:hypothetical protein